MSIRSYKSSPESQRKKSSVVAGSQVIGQFDFAGASPEDLPFKRGDVLTVESTSEDPNWWLAQDAQGRRGMVPANYVDAPDRADTAAKTASLKRDAQGNVIPMPWFHGKISRELAENLLAPPSNGLYLIRESTNFPGDYTLCVSCDNAVEHYRIRGMGGKLSIDEEVFFDSLENLIEHYTKDADGLCCKLVKPLIKEGGREFKVDRKQFSKGGWEIPRRELTKGTLLGSGQFGDVFEGTYQGKRVAIKTLKNVEGDAVDSFLAEAGVMTKLRHANLVELIGVCTQGSPIMLVVEFLALGNLLDYLRSRGRAVIKPAVQLKFAKDICSAMAYLEEKNFVHRDLAARNILLADENMAKVADFGLAKDSRLGSLDMGKLPIKWTAPEALRQKVSTSKSDVWSFGVVMWEIYSFGRAPYPRMNQKEVVDKVVRGYRMECPDACPKDVYDHAMMPCWEIDPIKRPTFRILLKKLQNL